MTERLHFHFSLSCIGEGNGNPLQFSCLENPREGGAWWAAVYGVAQGQTRLKWLSSSSSSLILPIVIFEFSVLYVKNCCGHLRPWIMISSPERICQASNTSDSRLLQSNMELWWFRAGLLPVCLHFTCASVYVALGGSVQGMACLPGFSPVRTRAPSFLSSSTEVCLVSALLAELAGASGGSLQPLGLFFSLGS